MSHDAPSSDSASISFKNGGETGTPHVARQGPTSRRRILQAGLASLLAPTVLRAAPPEGTLKLRVEETAGLRRFGYPVRTLVSGVDPKASFQLARGGRVVPAQFRVVKGQDGRPAVMLDFSASPAPFESEDYQVGILEGPAAKDESKRGMRVERIDNVLRVSNGAALAFDVPNDLRGFLDGVKSERCDYVTGDKTAGLWIRGRDDKAFQVGAAALNKPRVQATIDREGPFAAALRFESTEAVGADLGVGSVLELTFPSSKSWVEATWRIDDPKGLVSGIGLDLQLRLTGGTTLVDLGAGSTVYGFLKGKEHMDLIAGVAPGYPPPVHPWLIRKGPAGALTAFAEAPRKYSPPAEGWAHVTDKDCCTALAVAEFGRASFDRIDIEGGGRVRIERNFAVSGAAPAAGPKTLTFWLHFVGTPVQVGAVTSPQAALAPLKVTWR